MIAKDGRAAGTVHAVVTPSAREIDIAVLCGHPAQRTVEAVVAEESLGIAFVPEIWRCAVRQRITEIPARMPPVRIAGSAAHRAAGGRKGLGGYVIQKRLDLGIVPQVYVQLRNIRASLAKEESGHVVLQIDHFLGQGHGFPAEAVRQGGIRIQCLDREIA